jgi:subfamily B ATP-binding cassette protein MsbA
VEVIQGKMSGDDLFTFLFILFSIMSPITLLIHSVALYQRGYVASERVFKIIDQKPTIQSGKNTISKFNDSIKINNVSFGYLNEPVISNADFVIKKGKKIAFVGASGSGKSTMLDLIIRFYDPIEGEILLDNINIKDFTIESYRSMFGIVAQESMLFNDTVANNIKFGYPEATMDEIIEAAKLANAYNFIMKMPKGFDSKLGDRGILLSGGERQRISIARALVRNPQILVFDEATSSLDAESEKIVQDAINVSLKGRTAIIVAHRLSTIINCDEIFIFDNGRIVERGIHTELIKLKGIYKKLYDLQFAQKQFEDEIISQK